MLCSVGRRIAALENFLHTIFLVICLGMEGCMQIGSPFYFIRDASVKLNYSNFQV